ncbi:MAG: electron transfer flavoprotein subunit alpha [Anaerolineae bacterium]
MIIGLIEHDRGILNDLSLQMLTLGRRLAAQLNLPLQAVLIGADAQPLAERLPAYGVAVVHLAQHERLDDYAPEAWAQSMVELMGSLEPQVVLAAGSERGNEVMAHVASRVNLPLAANCTEAQPGEPFLVTRLRWGGSLLEEARLSGSVKLLTVAPHTFAAETVAPAGELTVNLFSPTLSDKDFRVRVMERVETAEGKISLAAAKVVVGGGRGVGSAEGFRALEELAGLLGGAVGCSRAVTSLGWRPHADQIGQTGTRIAPDLYIACGVSGAIQHMVGAKGAKRLLAINTDPEAPIVAKADYAIIGDLHAVLPALSAEIKKKRS